MHRTKSLEVSQLARALRMEMEIEMAPAAFWYFIVFGVAVY